MRNITPTDLNPLHRSLFFRRAEMRSHRKLFFAASIPTNDSVCSDNLCIDPVCPFDDCSSYPDPDSDPPSSSSSPYFPPSPVADDQSFQLSPFLIIVIAFISALLVLIFYYFTVVRLCRSCLVLRRRTPPVRRNAEEENHQVQNDMDMSNGNQSQVDHPIWLINTVGLQQSIINTITVVKYRRGEGLIEGTDCSVCLSEFQEDETLRLLPKCSHAFHIGCIDTWLRSHTNCPMCRAFIAVSGSEGPSNPSSSRSFGNSRGNEMAQVVDMEINEVELENSDNSNEVLVGSVNGIDVSVIDHSDQNKAEMSFEHGMKLLRRCESMSYINLRACTVHSSSVSLRRSISSGARLYTL